MPSIEATATFLYHHAGFGQDMENATKVLKEMIDAGHKYKQLEAALGKGVCLVLPTNIGESNWTKILTKSTERNRSVVQHLSLTSIPALARRYAPLRERIVSAKLAELQSLQHATSSEVVPGPSQNFFERFDIQDQVYWTDFNTNPSVDYETFYDLDFGP